MEQQEQLFNVERIQKKLPIATPLLKLTFRVVLFTLEQLILGQIISNKFPLLNKISFDKFH